MLRYACVLVPISEELGGGWWGGCPDLPGVMAVGESIREVLQLLEYMEDVWLEDAMDEGLEIPRPSQYGDGSKYIFNAQATMQDLAGLLGGNRRRKVGG